MPETTGGVTVVIVNWNSGDDLARAVASCFAQTHPPRQVVVVDNGSVDGSLAAPVAAHPELRVIRLGANRGFCGGSNAGIATAEADAVLLLNPDAFLSPDFLERALPNLDRDGVGFVAGKVLRIDEKTIDTAGQEMSRFLRKVIERGYGTEDAGQFDDAGPIDSVCGAVALYGRPLLSRLGVDGRLFDEDFFAFWEDADVGARARRAGFHGWYAPDARAYHKRGGTRPRDGSFLGRAFQILGRNEDIQFHILKNRYLYLAKNESWLGILLRAPIFLVVDGAVLLATALTRPRLFLRLLGIAPLLRRALSKRGTLS